MSWTRFFRRRRWDQERARELQAYLEIETDDNIARGLSPEDARHAAHRKLGNPFLIREEIYRMNTVGFLETLWQDLRYAARLLRLNPGFASVAILSLALGIGANTAIFQLLDAVRMRMLPVKDPQQLAEVRFPPKTIRGGSFSSRQPVLTNPQWEQLRGHRDPFSGMFAWSTRRFNLVARGEGRYVEGLWVNGEFFDVLGVQPLLGRLLGPTDDHRGCGASGLVISYPFWQREFGGDAAALGRKLILYGHRFEIVGVTPASFFGVEVGRSFDVALPLCSEALLAGADSVLDDRKAWWLAAIGRLKPGWTVERATAYLQTISPSIFQATLPGGYRPKDTQDYLNLKLIAAPAGSGVSNLRNQYSSPLWMLLGIAGLVLLIACANLASLMLARASAREREIAVRLAIGAARSRLMRQLLAESLLLAAIGAALGIILAQNLSRVLVASLSTGSNPLFVDLALDWRVLGFTAGLAMVTCVVFALVPALRATSADPGAIMKTSGRGIASNRGRFSLRRVLVVSQVALSLVLLVGALLFVRSLRNLLTLDMGFRQEGMLVVSIDVERPDFPAARRRAFHRDILDRIAVTPGVMSAAETAIVPVSGNGWNDYVDIQGSSPSARGKLISNFSRVSAGYFKTMGTPLLAGRDFISQDTIASPQAAIVNESFARKFLKGSNPIGATFGVEGDPNKPEPKYLIVGLVKDSKYQSVREDFAPIGYLAASQEEKPNQGAQFLIRSDLPLNALIPAIKRAIMEFDLEIQLNIRVMKTQIRETLLWERLMATLSGFFGVLAGVLATFGLYGVISYMVARRRNEIGIRIALGADRGAVIELILREAAVLLGIGLGIGTAVALAAGATARSMLFGLQPYDPGTIVLAIAILGAVALAASYLPARRAARLDPMIALREE
jgi:putative ABC transport system permease protein